MSKVIYQAKKIITMNPSLPEATYLAQDNGRIVAVGPYEAVSHLKDFELDCRFENKVIVPGFVEGHAHAMAGSIWEYIYVGYFDRIDPEGKLWTGVKSVTQLQERLKQAECDLPPGKHLVAWGFDPIYFAGIQVSRHDIDQVISDRSVVIIHASFHMLTVNSAMLSEANLNTGVEIEGIVLDAQGQPNGELQEMAALSRVFQCLENDIFDSSSDADGVYRYGRAAARVGITTITDLYNPLTDKGVDVLCEVTQQDDFPIRIVPAMGALSYGIEEGITRIQSLKEKGNDKLYFGTVKVMTDGSIQGFTARLQYPGYLTNDTQGLWNAFPETLSEIVHAYHQAGINMHIHTNGDEAVQLMVETLESAVSMVPWLNHRHTLQHCQLATQAQIKRIAKAGIAMNIFANHIYYWGDEHLNYTVGYERAQRLEPINSAQNAGVTVAIHSDAPVTPLNPIFSMSCAVTRKTASGKVLGTHEAVSAYDALSMVTINPAYTLHLDHLIGSLECGKFADFAVLDDDPLKVQPDYIKDINVVATVMNGVLSYEE